MCLTFGEGGGALGKVRHVSLLARFFILDGPLVKDPVPVPEGKGGGTTAL